MKIAPYPATDFLLSDEILETFESESVPQKRCKQDTLWKVIHEAAFSEAELSWPLAGVDELVAKGFRAREGELVLFSDRMFPAGETNVWEFKDSNHSFERTFKYPLSEGQEFKNQWNKKLQILYVDVLYVTITMV